ncbi:MAG TPA: hypothetical protein VFR10_10980 [bacterium]|nr:hypothetical protein [bacterium]
MILLPGGTLRASVWDGELKEPVMRDVTADLPFFLRALVTLHDQVTLKDVLLLAERHREFLVPLFTELLDEFVEEVKRPVATEEECDLDYLEVRWECFLQGNRFDLQPVLVGRNHKDSHVYSVEAVPTNAMGHLPVHLDSRFTIVIDDGAPEALAGSGLGILREFRREVRREFTLHDLFDAVLAEITFHGDPNERDTWWREIGSRESDSGETAGDET